MLGIVPLILIKISDIKFTSLIEFELDCVPYIDVLLTGGGVWIPLRSLQHIFAFWETIFYKCSTCM